MTNFTLNEIKSVKTQWVKMKTFLKKRAIDYTLADTIDPPYWLTKYSKVTSVDFRSDDSKVVFVTLTQTDDSYHPSSIDVMIPNRMLKLSDQEWEQELIVMGQKLVDKKRKHQEELLRVKAKYYEKGLRRAKQEIDELNNT
jgi:hypothetical protein